MIRPTYESLKINEAASQYLDKSTPLSSSVLVAKMFSFLRRKTKDYFIWPIDLNMVRAGVVEHPQDWLFGGYHEIQGRKHRNTILDENALLELLELKDVVELQCQHKAMIDAAMDLDRDDSWTASIAVGSQQFVVGISEQLKC